MKVETSFVANQERYLYDFYLCTTDKGWAQVDTRQDAWYFGCWLNPFTLEFLQFAEGDVKLVTFDSNQEMQEFFKGNYWKEYLKGIDPGLNKELEEKLIEVGLKEFVH
jgi:hypothetical protein